MEPKHLAELPFAFQVVAGLGLFFGTFMLAIGGWLWKTIKPKLPASLTMPEKQSEAVIVSAALADSHSIAKLAVAIEKLVQRIDDQAEDTERGVHKIVGRLGDMNDTGDRIYEVVCRMERHIKDRTIV